MGEPAFTALEEAFFAEGDAMSAIPDDLADEPTAKIVSGRGVVIIDDEYYAAMLIGSDVVSGEITVPETYEAAA